MNSTPCCAEDSPQNRIPARASLTSEGGVLVTIRQALPEGSQVVIALDFRALYRSRLTSGPNGTCDLPDTLFCDSTIAIAMGYTIPRGFVSLLFMIIFLGSINLTFTGILGVYLARIYNEVRARPSYIVGQFRSHSDAQGPFRAAAGQQSTAEMDLLDDLQPLPPTG